MIASADLRATLERSSDHRPLRAYLQQLVGQPFLLLRFSYGDELTFHLGRPREYRSSKLAHLTKGEYIIGARTSSWFLKAGLTSTVIIGTARPIAVASKDLTPLTPEHVETTDLLRAGSRVICAEVIKVGTRARSAYGFGLLLLLEEGASLWIRPSPSLKRRTRPPEIADWEIFTPYDRYLSVGPGLHWSYMPSRSTQD